MHNNTNEAVLREALIDERTWLQDQRKAISKGCGSSWDMMQCDERINLIDSALAATATVAEDGVEVLTRCSAALRLAGKAYPRTCMECGHGRCKSDLVTSTATAPEASAEQPAGECGACHGSGWVPRDPDIGTEQECFSCDGSGIDTDAAPISEDTGTKECTFGPMISGNAPTTRAAPERSGKTADDDRQAALMDLQYCAGFDAGRMDPNDDVVNAVDRRHMTALAILKSSPAPADSSSAAPSDERTAFEAWYAPRHDAVDFLQRDDGQYDDWDIALQWNAWQARAALAAPSPTGESLSAELVDYVYEHVGYKDRDVLVADVARMFAAALAPTVPGEPT